MAITPATEHDIPQLVQLLNLAYRGDASRKGWTTEASLLKGDKRTDDDSVNALINTPGALFLKHLDDQQQINGCVFLQEKEGKLYLGMLSVNPEAQAGGIGKQLMTAATIYARERKIPAIFMRVISVRHELINWYKKQGYTDTGVTEPFTVDERYGIPTQPLEFIILEKQISA